MRTLFKHKNRRARIIEIETKHGTILTPAFMPVGTKAAVNVLSPPDLRICGTQIILGGNTYHMIIEPGLETIEAAGGMHRFMSWDGPMLTDSGGYQVFSLSRNSPNCRIDQSGATFKNSADGRVILLSPEYSIAAQKILGADIVMALDYCTPEGTYESVKDAMELTHAWLERSVAEFRKSPSTPYGWTQQIFGIVQGGSFRDLRQESLRVINSLEVDGVALGGEAIGFSMDKTIEILMWLEDQLPEEKPHYAMGVGSGPQDLIRAVYHGIDMFDCVAPTRNARHGSLYVGEFVEDDDWVKYVSSEPKGRINITRGRYSDDLGPISAGCDCSVCARHNRAYLHWLYRDDFPTFANLACIHNVRTMQKACEVMRGAIIRHAGKL